MDERPDHGCDVLLDENTYEMNVGICPGRRGLDRRVDRHTIEQPMTNVLRSPWSTGTDEDG